MKIKNNSKTKILNELVRIRIIEEEIAKEYKHQQMRCPVHLSIGQEAIPVGMSSVLTKKDYIVSTHRCHAHYLAKGGSLDALLGELYGKETGTCKGVGGSMHMYDDKVNHLGSVPIVGGSIPVGVGIGYTIKLNKSKNVSVIYFGDAATEEGVFFESLHFAALKKLPIIFVCEDNEYSVYTSKYERHGKRDIKKLVKSMDVKFIEAKKNDVNDIQKKAKFAKKYALTKGPVFLYSKTYRYVEHCGPNNDDDLNYRPKDEVNYWKNKDPIQLEIKKLKKLKIFNEDKYLNYCSSVRKNFIKSLIKTKNAKSLPINKLKSLEYAK
tara:strand:+ start:416 stop:1384 length:969 start_codon:yes stop_codon:yes gene_type:complete